MKVKNVMVFAIMTFLSVVIVSCTNENGSGNNDNSGIEYRLKNDITNGVEFEAGHGWGVLVMRSSNNLGFLDIHSSELAIASVGSVSSLSKIKSIPETGWVDEIAAHPGTGYVIRYNEVYGGNVGEFHYCRLYVEDWIKSTSGGIIGAVIWYEDNWK